MRLLVLLILLAAALGWFLTRAQALPADATAGLTGDAARGEQVYWAAGCASCHAAPESEDKLTLAGGQRFVTPFGTFTAPNISPDPQAGIGGWSLAQFASAVTRGTSPEGQHYYPAFPYGSYIRMELQDVADLKAFMDTLPADATVPPGHDLGFPFNIRRGLGLWKLLFLKDDWVVTGSLSPAETRGRELAEALGHCGECHTPRNALGGLDDSRWMGGAPNPSGEGRIPNITPAGLDWEVSDIAYYLETGFTPEFDSAGGHMAAVVSNFGKLGAEDRQAVAAYLKRLAPVP